MQDIGVATAVPHLTTVANGLPALLYVLSNDTTHRLMYRSWEAGSWGTARAIAEDTAMLVNWADRPQLAFGPDGAAYAHWLRIDERGDFAYTIQAVRSDDGGKSWSEPVSPHKEGQVAEYGLRNGCPSTAVRRWHGSMDGISMRTPTPQLLGWRCASLSGMPVERGPRKPCSTLQPAPAARWQRSFIHPDPSSWSIGTD